MDTQQNEKNGDSGGSSPSLFLNKHVMVVGAVAFVGSIGEGSMGDWGSVYFHGTLGCSKAWAPAGFVAFNAMMTLVRFAGDHIIKSYSPSSVLVAGSLMAGFGLLAAACAPASLVGQITGFVGFACVGTGLATVVPIAFSAAGNVEGVDPAVGIAFVSTIAYAGMLVGPPLIGGVAQLTGSLRTGIALDGVLLLLMPVLTLATAGNESLQ